jgi:hypothetical protein
MRERLGSPRGDSHPGPRLWTAALEVPAALLSPQGGAREASLICRALDFILFQKIDRGAMVRAPTAHAKHHVRFRQRAPRGRDDQTRGSRRPLFSLRLVVEAVASDRGRVTCDLASCLSGMPFGSADVNGVATHKLMRRWRESSTGPRSGGNASLENTTSTRFAEPSNPSVPS